MVAIAIFIGLVAITIAGVCIFLKDAEEGGEATDAGKAVPDEVRLEICGMHGYGVRGMDMDACGYILKRSHKGSRETWYEVIADNGDAVGKVAPSNYEPDVRRLASLFKAGCDRVPCEIRLKYNVELHRWGNGTVTFRA